MVFDLTLFLRSPDWYQCSGQYACDKPTKGHLACFPDVDLGGVFLPYQKWNNTVVLNRKDWTLLWTLLRVNSIPYSGQLQRGYEIFQMNLKLLQPVVQHPNRCNRSTSKPYFPFSEDHWYWDIFFFRILFSQCCGSSKNFTYHAIFAQYYYTYYLHNVLFDWIPFFYFVKDK